MDQYVSIMRIREEFKVREMAGEHIVIMQGRYGVDMTKVISLNESSLYLWNELEGRDFEPNDVATMLVERYGIDQQTAEKDAAIWISKLEECKLL